MSYTPGPWKLNRHDIGWTLMGTDKQLPVSIANIPSWGEREAGNACLIAAAPELLEALCNIVANAALQPDARMGGATDVYAVPLDDIESAQAAIAKAEGGSK